MNGLLSMIGVVTRIDYQMDDFPFGSPSKTIDNIIQKMGQGLTK